MANTERTPSQALLWAVNVNEPVVDIDALVSDENDNDIPDLLQEDDSEEEKDLLFEKQLDELAQYIPNGDETLINDVTFGDMVEDIDQTWLWDKTIPSNKIMTITGAPESGKTWLWCDIVAKLSSGGKWPDGTQSEQVRVLCISGEDSNELLKQRIANCGGDLSNVLFMPMVTINDPKSTTGNSKEQFSLPRDFAQLVKVIKRYDVGAVVFDPVGSVFQNATQHQFVRSHIIDPLNVMCERLEVAAILINHTKSGKYNEQNLDAKIGNARAIVEGCRVHLFAVPNTEDPSKTVLRMTKNSYARKWNKPRHFTVEETELKPAHVAWIDDALQGKELPMWMQQLDDKAACRFHVMALLRKEGRSLNRGEIIRRLGQFESGAIVMAIKRACERGELSKDERGVYSLVARR